jgi:regulatory protein
MPAPASLPAVPDEASLHAAALAYLARYAATRATLTRVLDRQVERWARAAGPDAVELRGAARQAVRTVVDRLAAVGAVDDAAFAAARVRALARAGRSRAATGAYLAAHGVQAEMRRAALPEDAAVELAAALAFLRRRRLGPFRAGPDGAEVQRRELAALARAGFGREQATTALAMPREAAEAALARLQHV